MNKNGLTAIGAERIFGAVILLLLIGLVVDFIFVTNFLKNEAAKNEVSRQQSDSTDNDIAKLKSADAWLKENDEVVKRSGAIVAESKLYQYQNQIIEDLDSFGAQAGIPIVGYSFTLPVAVASPGATATPSTTPSTSGSTPAPVSPAPAASSTPTTTPSAPSASAILPSTPAATAPPVKVNSTTVTINFTEKVNYQNFLNLLRLLEQNVTRMQVTEISLTPDTKVPQLLISPTITIMVYTR